MMLWPDVMREQVRWLRGLLVRRVGENEPDYPVFQARCDVLVEYIDDLENGRLPAIEKARRG